MTARLNIFIETINQSSPKTLTSKSFPNEISRTISTGKAPIKSDGIAKVKINLIRPWKAPPWNNEGVINNSKKLLVTELASVKKKLVEKIAITAAKNTMVEIATSIAANKI